MPAIESSPSPARRGTELKAASEALRTHGPGAIEFRACDLSEVGQIAALIRGIRADFGPLYGLVNNAGLGTAGLLGTMRDRDIERLVRLNTLSPLVLTKYVARSMMVERRGESSISPPSSPRPATADFRSTAPPKRPWSASRARSPGSSASSASP